MGDGGIVDTDTNPPKATFKMSELGIEVPAKTPRKAAK
jgi:hypothetical protein